jgi:hypothetical protein
MQGLRFRVRRTLPLLPVVRCPSAAQGRRVLARFPVAADDAGKGLRVSRYLTSPGHVRFSVWGVGRVEAAVSIDEREARRLASFLRGTDLDARRPRLADRLRQSADALLETLR